MKGVLVLAFLCCVVASLSDTVNGIDYFQQTVTPNVMGDSLYFFCLNVGKVPSFSSNVSIRLYFEDAPSYSDINVSWSVEESKFHLISKVTKELEIPLVLNGNALNHWDSTLLHSGKFYGIVKSYIPLEKITFRMNSTKFTDILISKCFLFISLSQL